MEKAVHLTLFGPHGITEEELAQTVQIVVKIMDFFALFPILVKGQPPLLAESGQGCQQDVLLQMVLTRQSVHQGGFWEDQE